MVHDDHTTLLEARSILSALLGYERVGAFSRERIRACMHRLDDILNRKAKLQLELWEEGEGGDTE